jgi:hypothetical protein
MHHTNENPGAGNRRTGLDGVQLGSEHDHHKQIRHRTLAAEPVFDRGKCVGHVWPDRCGSQFRAARADVVDIGLYTSLPAAVNALLAEGGAH